MLGYNETLVGLILLALEMPTDDHGIVDDGFEIVEKIVKARMVELKNRSNKDFRERLRKCKYKNWAY